MIEDEFAARMRLAIKRHGTAQASFASRTRMWRGIQPVFGVAAPELSKCFEEFPA
jgi:hypothetical protein